MEEKEQKKQVLDEQQVDEVNGGLSSISAKKNAKKISLTF